MGKATFQQQVNKENKTVHLSSSNEEGTLCPWRRANMAKLSKAYTGDDDKYSAPSTDDFECKFMLFLERGEQTYISDEDRHCAISIMLTGHARQFYSYSLKHKCLSLMKLEVAVKSRSLLLIKPKH